MNAISIGNGQTEGPVYILSGGAVNVRFYAWAHPNQMPLRRIAIDPGDDGDPKEIPSPSLPNKKPKCGSDSSVRLCMVNIDNVIAETRLVACSSDADCPTGLGTYNSHTFHCSPSSYGNSYLSFGSTDTTGCKEGPEEFIIDYGCRASTPAPYKINRNTSGYGIDWDYVAEAYSDPDFVCVFKPKVQALDNWGWCTGTCNSTVYKFSAVKGDGCYAEMSSGSDCETNNTTKPWVPYNGYIVVVPTD